MSLIRILSGSFLNSLSARPSGTSTTIFRLSMTLTQLNGTASGGRPKVRFTIRLTTSG